MGQALKCLSSIGIREDIWGRHQRYLSRPSLPSEVPLTSLPPTVQDQSALPRVPRARDWLDAVREPTGIGRQSDDAVLVTFDDRMCVHCSALNTPMRSQAASSRSRAAHPHVPPPVRGRHTHTCLPPFLLVSPACCCQAPRMTHRALAPLYATCLGSNTTRRLKCGSISLTRSCCSSPFLPS